MVEVGRGVEKTIWMGGSSLRSMFEVAFGTTTNGSCVCSGSGFVIREN